MEHFRSGSKIRPASQADQVEPPLASAAVAQGDHALSVAAAAAAAAESGARAARLVAPPPEPRPAEPRSDRLLADAERGFFSNGQLLPEKDLVIKLAYFLAQRDLSTKDKVWLTDRLAFNADHRTNFTARNHFMAARLAAEVSDRDSFLRQLSSVWEAQSEQLSKDDKTSILRTALRFLRGRCSYEPPHLTGSERCYHYDASAAVTADRAREQVGESASASAT